MYVPYNATAWFKLFILTWRPTSKYKDYIIAWFSAKCTAWTGCPETLTPCPICSWASRTIASAWMFNNISYKMEPCHTPLPMTAGSDTLLPPLYSSCCCLPHVQWCYWGFCLSMQSTPISCSTFRSFCQLPGWTLSRNGRNRHRSPVNFLYAPFTKNANYANHLAYMYPFPSWIQTCLSPQMPLQHVLLGWLVCTTLVISDYSFIKALQFLTELKSYRPILYNWKYCTQQLR